MPSSLAEWTPPPSLADGLASGSGVESAIAETKASFAQFLAQTGVPATVTGDAADALVGRVVDALAHGAAPQAAITEARHDMEAVVGQLVTAASGQAGHDLAGALARGGPGAADVISHEVGGASPEAHGAAVDALRAALAGGADLATARQAAAEAVTHTEATKAAGAVPVSAGDALLGHLAGGGEEAAKAVAAHTAGMAPEQAAAFTKGLVGALAAGAHGEAAVHAAEAHATAQGAVSAAQAVPLSPAGALLQALASGADVKAALSAAGLDGNHAAAGAFAGALAAGAHGPAALAAANDAAHAQANAEARTATGTPGSSLLSALAQGGAEAGKAVAGAAAHSGDGAAFADALVVALAAGNHAGAAIALAEGAAHAAEAQHGAVGVPLSAAARLAIALATGEHVNAALSAAGVGDHGDHGGAMADALVRALTEGRGLEEAVVKAVEADKAANTQIASADTGPVNEDRGESRGDDHPGERHIDHPDHATPTGTDHATPPGGDGHAAPRPVEGIAKAIGTHEPPLPDLAKLIALLSPPPPVESHPQLVPVDTHFESARPTEVVTQPPPPYVIHKLAEVGREHTETVTVPLSVIAAIAERVVDTPHPLAQALATVVTHHAPVLIQNGAAALTTVSMGMTTPSSAITSLIADGWITDADVASAPKAVAITGADTANGSWQYSANGGTSWTNLSTLGTTHALLLDSSDSLRFVPNADWTGTTSLTYHAWDGTAGVAGAFADLSQGGTVFSVQTGTVTTTVTPTPAGFPASQSFDSIPSDWLLDGNASITANHLQLTPNAGPRLGSAYYDTPVSLQYGLHVTFDFYAGGGGGADGLSFYMFDGATEFPDTGQIGGALGYGDHGSGAGVPGAYMGIGFDTYGNFLNNSQWPTADGLGTGQHPNEVSIRGHGDGTTGYAYIPGSATNVSAYGGIDGGWRNVDLTITADQKVTLKMSWDNGVTWKTLLSDFDYGTPNSAGGYAEPATVKFGFAASTGGITDTHQVDNVTVSTLASAVLPVAYDDLALGLDGLTSVSLANTQALKPTGALTLETWFQVTADGGTLINNLSDGAGYQLAVDGSGHLTFTVGNGETTTLTDTATIDDGAWHQVAATYDGTTMRLLVDGAAHGSQAAGALGASAATTMTLGDGLKGAINETSIWSTARSQSQIQSDLTHSMSGSETGLAGYWKFDEATGTTVAGSSPGAPDGTILGAANHVDLNTIVTMPNNAAAFKGMVLGFAPTDQSLTYALAASGAPGHGAVSFDTGTGAFTYTPTSAVTNQDDQFVVNITDTSAHTVAHTVELHAHA